MLDTLVSVDIEPAMLDLLLTRISPEKGLARSWSKKN